MRSILRTALGAAAAAALAVATVTAVDLARPNAPTAEALVPKLFMVSDSVGLGAIGAMQRAFPGWQVTVVGKPGQFTETLANAYVRPQPASLFGDIAVVATGYNYPYWDPARFDRSIDLMISSLLEKGVQKVLWVTYREVKPQYISAAAWRQSQSYQWYLPTANQHLHDALWRWPQLSLVDWASIADRPGLTYDAIHLNTYGASEYAALVARTAFTTFDRIPARTVRRIPVAGVGGVPADAAGVAFTVAAVNPRTPSYVTVWPCGLERPVVSTLNVLPAETSSASMVLPIAPEGALCTYSETDTHLVIDVTGVFTASSGFRPITPARAVDTRQSAPVVPGRTLVVSTAGAPGLPANPRAVVLNVSTIGGFEPADVRVHPCDEPPPALAVRRTAPGAVQNLLITVRPDVNGNVCVATSTPTQVIVDVFGGFDAGSAITPVAPVRLFDTRFTGMPAPDATLVADLAAAVGTAPTGGVLVIDASAADNIGHVTAWPCDVAKPFTAFMNPLPNRDRTGSTLVGVSGGGAACLSPSTRMHLVGTFTGWTGEGFVPITPFRALDSRLG